MSMQVDGAYIEITSKCNMKCKQCYNDSEQRNNKFVTREEYVRTMKALVEHGCKIIVISGGEPLLHPDLTWMLESAHELGVEEIRVVTNGMLFLPEFAAKMKELGATLLISMDGPTAETYGILRDGRNFRRVKENVERYAKECIVEFNLIMCKGNAETLVAMADFADQNGIRTINLLNLQCIGRATDFYDEVALDGAEMEKFRNAIVEIVNKYPGLSVKGSVNPFEGVHCRHLLRDRGMAHYLRIDSHGDFFPCDSSKCPIGKMTEEDPSGVFEKMASCASREVRKKSVELYGQCKNCEARSVCSKGCPLMFEDQEQMKAYCEDFRRIYHKSRKAMETIAAVSMG